MSKLHVNHLKAKIEKMFRDKIDITDMKSKPQPELEKIFLTRGLAAYALHVLASSDTDTSAKSVVDGYDDNGIDAIFFDRNQRILWLVQSKWIEDGDGEPGNGEVVKFISGIHDIIDLKMDRFNSKIKTKENEIIEALNDPLVKIKILLTYTGQNFSIHNRRSIDDLLKELNDPSELSSFYNFSLKEAHKALTGSIDGSPIKVEVALSNWGQVEEPYTAFYGQINASDVAGWWMENRDRLFSDNIRNFIGLTEINEGIMKTLVNEPENFLYFNNGITVLCQKINKKPLGGGDKTTGFFVCEGISIVNGAQTVGCIGNAFEKYPDKVRSAKLIIRLISLDKVPTDLGVRITKATNTQNKIEKRDFVTLDPEQERLKTELSLEGKIYHYIRTDEKIIPDDKNCTLEEATIALACANSDVNLAVQAKREIGKLWEDTSKKPYTDIFNSSVTATKLWRTIQVLRDVNNILKSKELISLGREKSTYIHGNRFILNIVFQKISCSNLSDPNVDFENYRVKELPKIVEDIINSTKTNLEKTYPSSLVHQVFRNFTKCKELKLKIIS
ncbi:MAG: AIPR family protein [Candidatus Aenigmatarchaeota archaeon]